MPNKYDEVIGGNISRLRTLAGFSQKQFGSACKPPMRSQQISKYELGENQASASRLIDFARVLHCSVIDLIKGINDDKEIVHGRREDFELMRAYHALPERLQVSVRGMVHSMVAEFSA